MAKNSTSTLYPTPSTLHPPPQRRGTLSHTMSKKNKSAKLIKKPKLSYAQKNARNKARAVKK